MSALFSPIELRGVRLENRIAVSPMCQYAAVNGSANDWHLMHLGQFSQGAAGLLMTEATHVSAIGRITPACLGLYDDANQAALQRVVDFCRQWGVTPMGIQIAHAGRKASTLPPGQGRGYLDIANGGWRTLGPSALAYGDFAEPQAMDSEALATVKAECVATAKRALEIGFDVFELHGAHGYLLHQFLSPLSNQRDDEYGGNLENRMRYPLEVFAAVRTALPEDTPLGFRVSATDWVDGGWSLEETVVLSQELKKLGCDFVDVSSGGNDHRQKIVAEAGYQVRFAAAVRRQAMVPTWAVGMITEARQAESIIRSGQADMVAIARAMMFNPRWAWHAAEELGAETAYAKQYARCHPSTWPQVFANRDANGAHVTSIDSSKLRIPAPGE